MYMSSLNNRIWTQTFNENWKMFPKKISVLICSQNIFVYPYTNISVVLSDHMSEGSQTEWLNRVGFCQLAEKAESLVSNKQTNLGPTI